MGCAELLTDLSCSRNTANERRAFDDYGVKGASELAFDLGEIIFEELARSLGLLKSFIGKGRVCESLVFPHKLRLVDCLVCSGSMSHHETVTRFLVWLHLLELVLFLIFVND